MNKVGNIQICSTASGYHKKNEKENFSTFHLAIGRIITTYKQTYLISNKSICIIPVPMETFHVQVGLQNYILCKKCVYTRILYSRGGIQENF